MLQPPVLEAAFFSDVEYVDCYVVVGWRARERTTYYLI
jgi:hypothetical protein